MGTVFSGQLLHASSAVSKYYVPVHVLALAVSTRTNLGLAICPFVTRIEATPKTISIFYVTAICALI